MHLQEAVDLFLDQYKPSTRKAYAAALNPLHQRIGPAIPVTEITSLDMLRYVNSVKQNPAYSPATRRKHVGALKTFFNWLVNWGMIDRSPMADIKNVRVDAYIGLNKAMSDEQVERLYAFMDKNQIHYVRHKALVATLDDSGCRIGELAALRWPDVDFNAGTIYVTGKGDRRRPAFFFAVASFALHDWYTAQKRKDGDYVFSLRGGPIASASLQGMFRKLCIAAGIGSHGPHKMRHRKAHQLVNKGISPATAATVIGDTPEVFMQHYAPKDYGAAQEAARLVAQRPPANQKVITATTRKNTG